MRGMVESLTREQCLFRLSQDGVGRVSASKNALPLIVPVVYVNDGGNIVFHAPLDVEFASACDQAVIAFEIGEVSGADTAGWSVQVIGVASLVNGAGLAADQSARINLERVSGRQTRN